MQNGELTHKHRLLAVVAAVIITVILAEIAFSLIYAGKIYPGVSVDGQYLGGLNVADAKQLIKKEAEDYKGQTIAVNYGKTTLHVPVSALEVKYRLSAAESAMNYGRSGSLAAQLRDRLRSLFGRSTEIANYSYEDAKLAPLIGQAADDVTAPVANAALSFADGQIAVKPSKPGKRMDAGELAFIINDRLSRMSAADITAPVYLVTPTITEDNLAAAKHRADAYVAAPLDITAGQTKRKVDQAQILTWIDVTTSGGATDMAPTIQSFYKLPLEPEIQLTLNKDKVGAFVEDLAGSVDHEPKNAVLSWDGKLNIAQASQNGQVLDRAKALAEITKAVSRATGTRSISLAVASKEPTVNERNLDSLGIKELVSTGQTFFPGSPSTRLVNVRAGARQFNDVLLAPDEVFSFGKILGDVGPAQGYVPELVILGDHEEKQYGGGLCQVSSTAFRAALNAGFPILERVNHSFAISYYTAPFGVPGVDATIFYPQVDMKFRNDSGHYILIQTFMQGTTLTFDYFGTKTKSGVIRGPQFISGDNDTTKPSHTIFWRDVLDLNGNVVKTDTFNTYYESSLKYPVQKQFN